LVQNGNNDVDQLADGSEASQQRAAQLKAIFKGVEPIEITGTVDLRGKSPQEIPRLLPRFTAIQQAGGNPAFGILVDPKTGRVWSLRSGFSPDVVETVNGILFKSGTMTREVAQAAGGAWMQPLNPLGAHVEGQAAAFMRKMDIADAILYINAGTPCYGRNRNGCLFKLPELLAEGSSLTVFNKNGRPFPFTGVSD
jgi:hypothetical protein